MFIIPNYLVEIECIKMTAIGYPG